MHLWFVALLLGILSGCNGARPLDTNDYDNHRAPRLSQLHRALKTTGDWWDAWDTYKTPPSTYQPPAPPPEYKPAPPPEYKPAPPPEYKPAPPPEYKPAPSPEYKPAPPPEYKPAPPPEYKPAPPPEYKPPPPPPPPPPCPPPTEPSCPDGTKLDHHTYKCLGRCPDGTKEVHHEGKVVCAKCEGKVIHHHGKEMCGRCPDGSMEKDGKCYQEGKCEDGTHPKDKGWGKKECCKCPEGSHQEGEKCAKQKPPPPPPAYPPLPPAYPPLPPAYQPPPPAYQPPPPTYQPPPGSYDWKYERLGLRRLHGLRHFDSQWFDDSWDYKPPHDKEYMDQQCTPLTPKHVPPQEAPWQRNPPPESDPKCPDGHELKDKKCYPPCEKPKYDLGWDDFEDDDDEYQWVELTRGIC